MTAINNADISVGACSIVILPMSQAAEKRIHTGASSIVIVYPDELGLVGAEREIAEALRKHTALNPMRLEES